MPDPKDATQDKGVSEDQTTTPKPEETQEKDELTTAEQEALEKQKPPLTRREEMLNIVAERRKEELASEMGPAPEEEDEVLKDDTPKPDKKKAKKAEPSQQEEEDELIIEGTKQKVPKSKIYDTGRRALQKELAADKKLEEASKRAKEIVEQAQKDAEQLRQTKQRPSQEDAETTMPDLEDPEFDKKLTNWVSKIQYGSEDEGKQALKEILKQGRSVSPATPVKEDEVVEKVEQKLVLKAIRQKFETEFSDIVEDPELYSFAGRRVTEALKDGKPNTWETYQEIGQAVREKYIKRETTTETTESKSSDKPISLEQRREKKRSIDTLKPAGGRTPTTEAPMENPNPSATIAEIRKARHQR